MFENTIFYEIGSATIGAIITGYVLLRIHHSKIRQELEIHRNRDIFERKQKMYRSFVSILMSKMDLNRNPNRDFANWRIGDYLYSELLFIGSESVIKAFNKYLTHIKSSDDITATNLTKDVWIAIIKDLHDKTISRDEINFIDPTGADNALQIINKYYEILKKHNLTNFKSFVDVDADQLCAKTGIAKKELEVVKKTAQQELEIESEFKQFLENND